MTFLLVCCTYGFRIQIVETIALFPKEKDSFRNFLNASVCQKFSNDYGSVGALGRAPTGFLCALFMVRLI